MCLLVGVRPAAGRGESNGAPGATPTAEPSAQRIGWRRAHQGVLCARPRHLRQRIGGRGRAGARAAGGQLRRRRARRAAEEPLRPRQRRHRPARAAKRRLEIEATVRAQVRRRRHPGRHEDRPPTAASAPRAARPSRPRPARRSRRPTSWRARSRAQRAVEGTLSATLVATSDSARDEDVQDRQGRVQRPPPRRRARRPRRAAARALLRHDRAARHRPAAGRSSCASPATGGGSRGRCSASR